MAMVEEWVIVDMVVINLEWVMEDGVMVADLEAKLSNHQLQLNIKKVKKKQQLKLQEV